MTLELLLNIICDLAIKRNLVNYSAAGSSIYELNTKTVDSYPFIFVSPTGSIVTRKNFTDYGLTLFYVERLLEDNANDTRTYSIANDTLVNLVRQLRQLTGIVEITEPSVRLFNDERLNDRCCGAYAEITVTVLNDAECGLWFDEEGEFMGTYIPETLKEVDILDSLASKDWVARYVAEHSSEGMTEEQVKKLLKAYTKTEKFATINGSGITNNEIYNLLNSEEFENFVQSYTQEIENIYQVISASTPSDYDSVKGQVSANTENISILSAFTSGLSFTVSEHTQNIEQIESAITGINETLVTQNSAITGINETINILSAQTSANTAQILALSGYTEQVSANTQDIQTLSGITSGLSADLAALSAFTETLTGDTSNIAFFNLLKDYGTTEAEIAKLYSDISEAYDSGKTITVISSFYNGTQDIYAFIVLQKSGNGDFYGYGSGMYFDSTSLSAARAVPIIRSNGYQNLRVKNGHLYFESYNAFGGYTLPTAAANTKGGVRVGTGLSMNGEVMSADVASSDVHIILALTKAQYEALATKDPYTLYVIKPTV